MTKIPGSVTDNFLVITGKCYKIIYRKILVFHFQALPDFFFVILRISLRKPAKISEEPSLLSMTPMSEPNDSSEEFLASINNIDEAILTSINRACLTSLHNTGEVSLTRAVAAG